MLDQLLEDLGLGGLSYFSWLLVVLPLVLGGLVGWKMYKSIMGCKDDKMTPVVKKRL